MSTREFCLPDVGEGLQEAEIVGWQVKVGDEVTINQVLVEIETAKSVVELPSPFTGVVQEILVENGQTVSVGTAIIRIASAEDQTPEPRSVDMSDDQAPDVLVGYGPTDPTTTRRRRLGSGAQRPTGHAREAAEPQPLTRTKPPVRKLAKTLGVDLGLVVGTGEDGVITRDDVLRYKEQQRNSVPEAADGAAGTADDEARESVSKVPVTGVRKATADAMSKSAFTAPHATEFVTVDVTRAVKLGEKLRDDARLRGARVTMTLLVARALLAAIREHPSINASWHGDEIWLHHQVNLGIAAATPRGLLVPNIKDAGALTLVELAKALDELVGTARDGKCSREDLSNGTITITNIGVFGVDSGTPILNPGEAAILCIGAVRRRPWEHKGKMALRSVTELSLSFDHRLVDGELGSKVLARVARILENPKWELLFG